MDRPDLAAPIINPHVRNTGREGRGVFETFGEVLVLVIA